MIRLAANLSMMFTEVPFMDRFAAAARAGFRGVEYKPRTQTVAGLSWAKRFLA